MESYTVKLAATARVSTQVVIEASSKEDAELQAIQSAKGGDVVWNYDGVEDNTIEIGW